MSIVSFYFPFFVTGVILLYFIVPKKNQWYVLLTSNVLFYLFSGIKGLIVVSLTTLFCYAVAMLLQSYNNRNAQVIQGLADVGQKKQINDRYKKKKNFICFFSIVAIIALWLCLKLGSNVNESFFVPLGISFYSLNAIGYLIDINRKKFKTAYLSSLFPAHYSRSILLL